MKKLVFTVFAVGLGLTASIMAQVPSYVPTNGLVGWWPFNGNANDESGNGNNGTVNGATLTADRFGNLDKAYNFISTNNNSISVNNNPLQNGTATISGWFNPITPIGGPIFHVGSDNSTGGNCNGYFIGFGNIDNPTGINLFLDASCQGNYNTGWIANSNIWYHFILIRNLNNLSAYINGNLVGSFSPSSINAPSNNIFFGTTYFNNAIFFNGKIDDVGIWNRVLSQQEITALYNSCQGTNITSQPSNSTVTVGSSAQFSANALTGSTFQWQSNPLDIGWQNVNNNSTYSGATTNTLTVANTSISNHNQLFRAIVNTDGCIDTSDVAQIIIGDTCLTTVTDTLIINTTLSLPAPNNENTILIYPNPASDHITIDNGNFAAMAGYSIKIENNAGQQVFQSAINQQQFYVDLSTWTGNGLYFVHLIDPQNNTVTVRKIVLQ